jgi:probable F420-dependent oxidoreductase
MRLGVIFPHNEIGNDPVAIRDWAQAAEELGYDHITAYDHVLGANADGHPELSGPYRHRHAFHEPFVLFGHLAAVTSRIGLATGILILPQRQTALVAKQAAAVDVLSGGRLRLGVGLGWNYVEYEALGENFHNRGRRIEEQVEVLRRLWCEELVTFEGRWHKISDAGLNPLPVQRPIPIWFGASAGVAIRRAGRLADGWIAMTMPKTRPDLLDIFRDAAREAGRDPASLGLEALIGLGEGGPDDWARTAEDYLKVGVTHVDARPMNAGLATPDAHIEALRRFRDAVGDLR